jgi:hypothetical protein
MPGQTFRICARPAESGDITVTLVDVDVAEDHTGQAPKPNPVAVAPAPATFMLKRFAWGAPDRLEVSGTFAGLLDTPADASPVLIVSTGERMHRLPAVPDSLVASPEEGRLWRAAFAWQDAPVAFDVAQLQIGANVVVQLPEPATRRLSRPRALEVRTGGTGDDLPETAETASDEHGERASIKANGNGPRTLAGSPREDRGAGDGAERVSSKVDLLAAQEQVLEVGAALQQTREELTRARDDLSAERERHAEDRERFREGLAKLQESAEESLAVEQSATQQLGADLREAQAEIDALRERLATHERAVEEADQLRSELEQSRTQADTAQAGLEAARSAVGEARTDAERLLGRLTALAK